MDLVSAAVGMQQARTAGMVQVAVAKKAMDNQQMMGASMIKLLQSAATGAAQAGDAMVAAATGLGGSLDTYA